MKKWKYNDNVVMEFPEFTLEAFDKFANDFAFKVLVPEEGIKVMRDKFKKDFNL